MYQLYETAVHHFLAQDVIPPNRNLLGRELCHGFGIEFFAHLGAHGVNKHLEELVHTLGGCFAELVVVNLNVHN